MIGFTVAYRHSLYTITIVSTCLAPWNWSSAQKFGLKIVHHVVMGFPKARLGCPWLTLVQPAVYVNHDLLYEASSILQMRSWL